MEGEAGPIRGPVGLENRMSFNRLGGRSSAFRHLNPWSHPDDLGIPEHPTSKAKKSDHFMEDELGQPLGPFAKGCVPQGIISVRCFLRHLSRTHT